MRCPTVARGSPCVHKQVPLDEVAFVLSQPPPARRLLSRIGLEAQCATAFLLDPTHHEALDEGDGVVG